MLKKLHGWTTVPIIPALLYGYANVIKQRKKNGKSMIWIWIQIQHYKHEWQMGKRISEHVSF